MDCAPRGEHEKKRGVVFSHTPVGGILRTRKREKEGGDLEEKKWGKFPHRGKSTKKKISKVFKLVESHQGRLLPPGRNPVRRCGQEKTVLQGILLTKAGGRTSLNVSRGKVRLRGQFNKEELETGGIRGDWEAAGDITTMSNEKEVDICERWQH